MKRLFSVLCLVWLLPQLLPAQEGALRFEHLTVADGLAADSVYCIHQDAQGFIWIGTDDGLNRYDGYHFKAYKKDPADPDSLSGNNVVELLCDRNGRLWVGTDLGLDRFDRASETFIHFPHSSEQSKAKGILSLLEDQAGTLWIGTSDGLRSLDRKQGAFTHYQLTAADNEQANTANVMHQDRAGRMWIGTGNGLALFDPDSGQTTFFTHGPDDAGSLSHPHVLAIVEDEQGYLWLGTEDGLNRFDPDSGLCDRYRHAPTDPQTPGPTYVDVLAFDQHGVLWMGSQQGGGLSRLDLASGKFFHSRHDSADPRGLRSELMTSIYLDRSGVLWLGSLVGVSKYNTAHSALVTYRRHEGMSHSLSSSEVWSVVEDRQGILWLGTPEDGIDRFDRKRGTVVNYRHHPERPQSLQNGPVTMLHEDRSGALWVGTWGGGLSRFDPATQQFHHYRHDANDPRSLQHDSVQVIHDDRSGRLWVGTVGSIGGIAYLDRERERFTRMPRGPDDPAALGQGGYYAICEDSSGDLWFGSFSGLYRLHNDTDRFQHFSQDHAAPERGPASNAIASLWQDRAGILWIGTFGDGVSRLDPAREEFTHYRAKDGLANDTVVGILDDDNGYLWLATHRGLSRYDPRTEIFKNLGPEDGVQGYLFGLTSSHRCTSGELLFGGSQGLNAFFPDQIQDDPHAPQVVITDFKLFNQPVPLRRVAPASPLAHSILDTREIVLSHAQYNFSLEFAALHYANPDKNRYLVRLDGFDPEWIIADAGQRVAQYSNVPPGSYTFRVRASNPDGVWSEQPATLAITIRPPPWRTWWAYLLYTALLAAIVLGVVQLQKRKLDREREINRRLREVDLFKDEFLANTSHELRTPLYGITGLVESIIDGARGEISVGVRTDLEMVITSARRLSGLVNDILDFSKMKQGALVLQQRPVDLRALADVVLTLSRALTGSKLLQLENAIPPDLPPANADEDRLEQILHNLVGNAIKFTEAGTVTVSAGVEQGELVVSVSDTGIGIPGSKLQRIFHAFQQADASIVREHGGTGLGLAITRKLVDLHGGRIWAESQPGEGSTFSFSLPVSTEPLSETARAEPAVAGVQITELDAEPPSAKPPEPGSEQEDTGRILVTDDEPIIRQILTNHLFTEGYQLQQASSGAEALRLMEEGDYDLVLLDVMMPKMSGYEVCRMIREKHSIQDLPVIFLTAKNRIPDLVTGFAVGANDYLTKPITKSELLARVKAHLSLVHVHRSLEQLVTRRGDQVKTLSGLLPICANCKRIRDDQGYWQEVESYIDEHSQASFSHGICPECVGRLYANEIDLDQLKR